MGNSFDIPWVLQEQDYLEDDGSESVIMTLNIKGGPIITAHTRTEALDKFKDAMRVFMLGCTMLMDDDSVRVIYARYNAFMDETYPAPGRSRDE